MIFTQETLKDIKTPSAVKYGLKDDSYFFSRKTMRFFGDTMRSFGLRMIDGKLYLYRKPSAYVNVFGKIYTAGRTYFGAWEVIPKHDHLDIMPVSDEIKELVYSKVAK